MSVDRRLDTINVGPKVPGASRSVGAMFERYRWWMFAYVVGTSVSGIALGAVYGWLIAARKIRRFSTHHWVYALNVDGLTYACVLTRVSYEDWILM